MTYQNTYRYFEKLVGEEDISAIHAAIAKAAQVKVGTVAVWRFRDSIPFKRQIMINLSTKGGLLAA